MKKHAIFYQLLLMTLLIKSIFSYFTRRNLLFFRSIFCQNGIKSTTSLIILILLNCTNLKQANRAFKENDYQQTIQLCRQAIAADSTHAKAYLLLGKSYRELDSLDLAFEMINRAHKLTPNSSRVKKEIIQIYIDLGDRAYSQGNQRKSLSHYISAEKLEPDNKIVIQRIAEFYYKKGQLEKSKSRYEKLIHSKPYSSKASERITKIEKRTQNSKSLYQKGMKALKNNKLKRAKKLFTKALKEKSDFNDAQYQLYLLEGRLLFKKGSLSALWDAIEAFGKAMSLHPEAAEPHFRLAQAYEKKDTDELVNAIDEYQAALRFEPAGPFADSCKKKIRELQKRKEKLDRFWGKGK